MNKSNLPSDSPEWLDDLITDYDSRSYSARLDSPYDNGEYERIVRDDFKASILTKLAEARIDELRKLYPQLEQGYAGGTFVLRASRIDDRLAALRSVAAGGGAA